MHTMPTHQDPFLEALSPSPISSMTFWSKYILFLYQEMVVIKRSQPPSGLSLGVPLVVSSMILALGLAVVSYLRPAAPTPVPPSAPVPTPPPVSEPQQGSARKKTVRFVN